MIPETVRDAVLARAARLTPAARALLDAVAIAAAGGALCCDGPPRRLSGLDECLASGMLVETNGAVAFRHELARLAVEEGVAPDRGLVLHRATLAALGPHGDRPRSAGASCAAARDTESVLEFAPAAGARASELGATGRPAQYARAALRRGLPWSGARTC